MAPGASRELQRQLRQYRDPSLTRSVGQIVTSFAPYLVGLVAMGAIAQVSYLLSLLLALPTAGFLIRVFIIFHDAGHGSFFRRSRWNRALGYLAGILTFTPFQHWTHEHAMHHATAGDLDRRDLGDVWTMTVQEFVAAPRRLRLAYRVFRNPFVLFFLVAPIGFLFNHRIPRKRTSNRAKWAIVWTNLGVALFVVAMSLPFGFVNFSLVFTPVFLIASTVGTWLFYVQHQFEGVYWRRHEGWDYVAAALSGSSYLALPRVLQWFTGNHRLPPHPPPRPTHPQLPPGARPPGAAHAAPGSGLEAARHRTLSVDEAVRRDHASDGQLPRRPAPRSSASDRTGSRLSSPWRSSGCIRAVRRRVPPRAADPFAGRPGRRALLADVERTG